VALISIVGRDCASGEPRTVTVMTRNIYWAGTSSVRYARRWTVRVCSPWVMRTIGCRPAPIYVAVIRCAARVFRWPPTLRSRSVSPRSAGRRPQRPQTKTAKDPGPLPRGAPMAGALFHMINMALSSDDTASGNTS
jgi:hypothetical protein